MGTRGAIIMGFFGALFVAMTLHLQRGLSGPVLACPFLVFVLIGGFAAAVMRLPGQGMVLSARAERAILWSSTGEGIGIFLAANIVMNLHRPALLMPAIALVVGLHFLPMAHFVPFRPFYGLGAVLLFAAAAGSMVRAPMGGEVAGFGAAAALWIASVFAVLREWQAKQTAPRAL